MNIFSNLHVGYQWEVKSLRFLTQAEKSCITKVDIVPAEWGYNARFETLNDGELQVHHIPLSAKCSLRPGFTVSPDRIVLVTLSKEGYPDICRIEYLY